MVKRNVSFQKRYKKVDNSITLVLTCHPALHQFYEFLLRLHKHVPKSPRLHDALPSQTRVASLNSKTIRDNLVLSKLKKFMYKDAGINICGHSNFDIYKIFEKGDQEKTVSGKTVTKKKYRFNFPFDCNNYCVVYLMTC